MLDDAAAAAVVFGVRWLVPSLRWSLEYFALSGFVHFRRENIRVGDHWFG